MKTDELLDAALRLIHGLTSQAGITATAAKPSSWSCSSSWQVLSPLTRRVVRLLASKGWLTREEIARELSEPPEGKITVLLPDLVDRGIIESSPRKGYQIALPLDVDPEAFRRQLLQEYGNDQP